jgi:nitroreductase
MLRGTPLRLVLALILAVLCPLLARADEAKPVSLPKPQTDGGMPLMQALKERKTARAFSPQKLPPQLLSNLLWAADGVSRPDGRRTAPSAKNWQEIDVYVTTADGVFLYDAKANALIPVSKEDVRADTGKQAFIRDAPATLVFVADLSRVSGSDEEKALCVAADTGYISQNVYLFAASAGLATGVRAWLERVPLAKLLHLRPDQRIILAQSIGYPKWASGGKTGQD